MLEPGGQNKTLGHVVTLWLATAVEGTNSQRTPDEKRGSNLRCSLVAIGWAH
jgi:hypothetical protein